MAIVVTVARQHGSGGRLIGQHVARLLNANYVDRQLIGLAAQRAGVPEEVLAESDERPITLVDRIVRSMRGYLENSADLLLLRTYGESRYLTPFPHQRVDQRRYSELIFRILRELAEAGSLVVMGRGGAT